MLKYCLLWSLVLIALLLWTWPIAHAQSGLVFDDSAPGSMRLSNSHYDLALSKTNGAILSLVDKQTGTNLTQGSRGGCLWGAVYPGHSPDYVGGCSFSSTGSNHFVYSWNATSGALALTYAWQSGVTPSANAVVTLSASTDAFFDLRLTLDNRWGATAENVLLPLDLLVADSDVKLPMHLSFCQACVCGLAFSSRANPLSLPIPATPRLPTISRSI